VAGIGTDDRFIKNLDHLQKVRKLRREKRRRRRRRRRRWRRRKDEWRLSLLPPFEKIIVGLSGHLIACVDVCI
jgi:hypothetical protein